MLAVPLLILFGIGGVSQPASAVTGGYPWDDATTLNASTFDWGYATCPSNDTGCKGIPYSYNGTTYGEEDPYGYYLKNCTSYVAWKLTSLGVSASLVRGLGYGGEWYDMASGRTGVTRGTTPHYGDAAVQEGNPGHVAFVESVNGDGTITVSEYNYGSQHRGAYNTRTGTASALGFTKFVGFGLASTSSNPFGSLDSIQRVPGGINASGWAIDPDTSNPITVNVYGGDGSANSSNPIGGGTANGNRPDVGNAYPSAGPNHGYSGVFVPAGPGNNTICAYGINASGTPGGNSQLQCKSYTVDPTPFGSMDSAQRVSGGIEVKGWAIDPDVSSSIAVHIYGGNGQANSSNPLAGGTANGYRGDLASAFPGYGGNHAFDITLATGINTQTVCMYAINADNTPGGNVQVKCVTL